MPPLTSKAVEIAGLKLVFRRSCAGVNVTDADTGTWVANIYGFRATSGPFLRHNYQYRAQFGIDSYDPRGAEARSEVCKQAEHIY